MVLNSEPPIFDSSFKPNEIMKNQFDLKSFMTENREIVINAYNEASKHRFFNEISLARFMTQVLELMIENNPKSEKSAKSLLDGLTERVFNRNTKIGGNDVFTDRMRAKYKGTAMMAVI